MHACWPCIRNRIHPAIDYFVFSGAHPRSVNIRGLQQNMKLAFSPHPLHASALLFMSRCERMCVNALAQDGCGYREMCVCVCFGSGALWKKKTCLTGVHRCCIDALTLYIFQKNKHVLSDVHAYFEMYIALHSGLHVNQSGLFLLRWAELAVRWLRNQVVVSPPSHAVSAGQKCFLLSPRELRKALLKRYCKCSLSSIFTRIHMHFLTSECALEPAFCYLANVQNLHFWIKQHYIWRKKRTLTFPGSSLERGTLRKHLFNERLCRIEFCRRKGRKRSV